MEFIIDADSKFCVQYILKNFMMHYNFTYSKKLKIYF